MTAQLPDHAAVVNAMLDGFVQACAVIIEAGLAPADPLDAKIRYQLEPEGEEDWKLPQNVIRDGWGDCEDINGWRAAGLRVTGEDPDAKCVVVRTGPGKLHAVVLRSDGSYDDACADLMAMGRANVPQSELGASRKQRGVKKVVHKRRHTPDNSNSQRAQDLAEQRAQEDVAAQQAAQQAAQAASPSGGGASDDGGGGGPSWDPSAFFGGGGGGGGGDDLSQMWDATLEQAFSV